MFNTTLENIIKRENYIDNLSEQQISTIQIKELFFKAMEQSSSVYQINKDIGSHEQKLFCSSNLDGPAKNLLKHILPAPQNSYEDIEQLQMRMNLINSSELNQVQILKQMFDKQKDQIKKSGLKAIDFLDLYQSLQMQGHEKDINDPLEKKIMKVFQTNPKEYSLYQLLNTIIESLSPVTIKQVEQEPQAKVLKNIKQSLCSLQGIDVAIDDEEDLFNEDTKKQMDTILSYFQNTLQIFDIQNQN